MRLFGIINSWLEKVEEKVREIRSSSRERRKRWVIISSSITMALVLILWVAYMSFALPVISSGDEVSEQPANNTTLSAVKAGVVSIYKGISNTVSTVVRGSKRAFNIMEGTINTTREIKIESNSRAN